jgi:hypothetical protein
LSRKVRLSETTSSASLEVYADEIYRILDTVRVKTIKGMPKVRLLPGETSRDFVLDHKTEQAYLKACPPLLHDVAVVLLDSALRLGEALALQWNDVHLGLLAMRGMDGYRFEMENRRTPAGLCHWHCVSAIYWPQSKKKAICVGVSRRFS